MKGKKRDCLVASAPSRFRLLPGTVGKKWAFTITAFLVRIFQLSKEDYAA